MSRINTSDTKIQEVRYIPSVFSVYENGIKLSNGTYDNTFPTGYSKQGNFIQIDRSKLEKLNKERK